MRILETSSSTFQCSFASAPIQARTLCLWLRCDWGSILSVWFLQALLRSSGLLSPISCLWTAQTACLSLPEVCERRMLVTPNSLMWFLLFSLNCVSCNRILHYSPHTFYFSSPFSPSPALRLFEHLPFLHHKYTYIFFKPSYLCCGTLPDPVKPTLMQHGQTPCHCQEIMFKKQEGDGDDIRRHWLS